MCYFYDQKNKKKMTAVENLENPEKYKEDNNNYTIPTTQLKMLIF